MYHKIRITVAAIVVMALCMLSSTMTLSYFTDSKSATNEFTVGNASASFVIYDNISGEAKHVFDVADYSPLIDGNIPFYLQATNNGNIPVYQRFRIVIPKALASIITLDLPDSEDYTVTYEPSVNDTYAEYYILNTAPLAVDATTNEWPEGAKITISGLNDTNKSLFTCSENGNNNDCVFGIDVYSDVVQVAGFANAATAFAGFTETYRNN